MQSKIKEKYSQIRELIFKIMSYKSFSIYGSSTAVILFNRLDFNDIDLIVTDINEYNDFIGSLSVKPIRLSTRQDFFREKIFLGYTILDVTYIKDMDPCFAAFSGLFHFTQAYYNQWNIYLPEEAYSNIDELIYDIEEKRAVICKNRLKIFFNRFNPFWDQYRSMRLVKKYQKKGWKIIVEK